MNLHTPRKMNKTMIFTVTAAGLALGTASAQAAAVAVDWLQLAGGGSPAGFSLRNDTSAAVVTGKMTIANGVSFPGLPAARTLNAQYWQSAPHTLDSLSGDGAVSAFEVRVAPVGGAANYSIELSVPAGYQLVLAVGELYRSPSAFTSGVGIAASGGAGSVPVTLLETLAWSDGVKSFSADLGWDGNTLSTLAGQSGDSKIAFFGIDALSGPNPTVTLSVPAAYASGTGDSLTFALGLVAVPEPSAILLGMIGLTGLLRRRR